MNTAAFNPLMLGVSVLFAWLLVRAVRRGTVITKVGKFSRAQSPVLFWGVLAVNAVIVLGALCIGLGLSLRHPAAQPGAAALALGARAEAAPAGSALAREVVVSSGDAARLHAYLETWGKADAAGFALGARNPGESVDQAALDLAVAKAISEEEPAFLDAAVRAYDTVYTPRELRLLIDFYHVPPGRRAVLVGPLAAKADDLVKAKAINVAGLGTRFMVVLFETYCGQASCSDAARKKVAALAKAAPGH